MLIAILFYVVETIMMSILGLWFTLILILLLLSSCLPSAFLVAIVAFYVPIIVGLIYILAQLMGEYWFAVALICLGLFLV